MLTQREHRRLLRLSAGALLLSQRRATEMVKGSVRAHVRQAQRGGGDRTSRMRSVLVAGAAMAPVIANALERGRKAARVTSLHRLEAEADAAGERLVAAQRAAVGRLARVEADEVASRYASESLVAQWRGIALSLGDDDASVKRVERLFAARLERAAETESAVAYSDERRARLAEAVRVGEIDPRRVLREWNATADACERCWPLHGTRVGADEDFDGYEPGSVHPRCRCSDVLVLA